MNYYSVRIEFHQNHLVAGESFKLLMDFDEERKNDLIRRIWAVGWPIQTSPTAWEVVSPYIIKSVMILLQDKKYGI